MPKRKRGETVYSKTFEGAHENYHWQVRFDLTDSTLGISQIAEGKVVRVLLSGAQVKALQRFLKEESNG